MKPYRTYRVHLRQYEQAFLDAVTREFPLSDTTRTELDFLKNALALRNEDIHPIETRLLANRGIIPSIVPTPGQAAVVAPAIAQPVTSSYAQSTTAPGPRQNRWLLSLAMVLLLGAGAAGTYWGVLWWRSQQQQGQQQAILQRSEDFAAQQNWGEAIRTASQVPTGSPLYSRAQERMNLWANSLVQNAVTQLQGGNFDAAMNLLQAVPPGNPVYDQLQAKKAELQQNWQNDQALFKKVQDVHLAVNDFSGARGLLTGFSTEYLKKQAENLITVKEQSSAAFEVEKQRQIAAEAQRRAELERQRQEELRRRLADKDDNDVRNSPSPSATGATCYKVTANGFEFVNIRSAPNPATSQIGPSIGRLLDGQVIQATGTTITALNEQQKQGQYIQITSPQQGWVSSEFALPVGCPSGGGGGLL